MKTKLFNILAAALLVFGVLMPAFAVMAQDQGKSVTKTKTVTLHKILMKKDKFYDKVDGNDRFPGRVGFDRKNYIGEKLEEGVQKSNIKKFFGDSSEEISGVYFAWQKKDEFTGQWRYINYLGHMFQENNIKKIKDEDLFGQLTDAEGTTFDTRYLEPGKYRLVEVKEKSTYKGNDESILADSKAAPVEISMPIVNANGVVEHAHVYPKNTEDKPKIAKNFGQNNDLMNENGKTKSEGGAKYDNVIPSKATASIGQEIPYEVKTKVNAGTEYGKLVWKDSMTNGLTLNKTINIKAEYSKGEKNQKQDLPIQKDIDYEINEDDRGFTLYLTQAGLKKVTDITKPKDKDGNRTNEPGRDVEFTLTYSANVNGNAIVDVPEKNDIRLEYGNKPYKKETPAAITPASEKLQVTKSWVSDENIPEDVTVTYILKKDNDFYSVTLNKNTIQKTYDLGKGVKFEVIGKFNGIFSGLAGQGWTLSERVAGYNAEIKGKDNNANHVGNHAYITNTKDKNNPKPLHPTSPEVVVGGRRFVKTEYKDGNEAKRLTGASFYIKKSGQENKYLVAKDREEKEKETQTLEKAKTELETKITKWNQLTLEEQEKDKKLLKEKIKSAQEAFNAAFKTATIQYTWTDKKEATKFYSDNKGQFEVRGLAYGEYELEEETPPTGYAKLSENPKFEIKKGSYKSDETEIEYNLATASATKVYAQQIKNRKITIPQTGGIGTVIFTVAGLAIMVGAGYVMVRRRNHDQA